MCVTETIGVVQAKEQATVRVCVCVCVCVCVFGGVLFLLCACVWVCVVPREVSTQHAAKPPLVAASCGNRGCASTDNWACQPSGYAANHGPHSNHHLGRYTAAILAHTCNSERVLTTSATIFSV